MMELIRALLPAILNFAVIVVILWGNKNTRNWIKYCEALMDVRGKLYREEIKQLKERLENVNSQRINSILHLATKIEEMGSSVDKMLDHQNENDMQIAMLCSRLKVQREESMAAAIADATMNPEKYTHGSFETLNIAAEKRDDQVLESGV